MTVVLLTEEDLRRLHAVQLDMLMELDRVCCRLGVAYQLGAGSLLGAVRHAGFIPWDKDMDVVMLRADYRRFLREAPQHLNPHLFLQSWHSDPSYLWLFAKLRRHDSIFLETSGVPSGQHQGIFIDIFPFDPVWPECWWWRGLHAVVLFLDRWLWKWKWKWKFLAADGKGNKGARSLLMAMHDGLLRSLALVPSRQVVCLASGSLRWERLRTLTRPITEFEQTLKMPFEGMRFPVTANYHQALTRLYGDYMVPPPPNKRTVAVEKFCLPGDGGLSSEPL